MRPEFVGSAQVRTGVSAMPGRRNVFGILLRVALGGEEIIVAAASAGIGPTDSRSRLVDRAASFVGIEKAAHLAEMRVRFATHGIVLVAIHLGELSPGHLKVQTEMIGKAMDVAL